MPVQGLKTPMPAIRTAIEAQLYDVLELPENMRHLVMWSRIEVSPRFQADQDIVLRMSPPRPHEGLYTGGGIITPGVRRGLFVQLRTRASYDVSDRIDTWLGVQFLREDQIFLALTGFIPVDEDSNVLTIQEMRLEDGEPYKDILRQIPSPDPTWGSSMLIFAIDYCHRAPDLPEPE